MKSYKIWLIVVLALLAINSAALALMWFHHKRPPMAREHGMPMQQHMEPKDVLINALAFTPKQATQFDDMRTRHRATVNKLNEENHKLRDSLFTNIKKPKADSAVINSIAKKISDNQAAIEKTTLYHFRELRAILTPEQQTKFDGIITQVLQMMGNPGPPQGRQPMGGNGPQPNGEDKMPKHQRPPQGMQPGTERDREHMGPPPNGMPPPGDHRGHRPPPRDGRPPGPPDGFPPDGPPPGGGPPPNGPPPGGQPPL